MPELYIGLMSGTSMDGIDAALVDFSQNTPRLLASHSHEIPATLKQSLLQLSQNEKSTSIDQLGEADSQLGKCFAEAVLQLLSKANILRQDIIAIGSHGQTIRHRPDLPHRFSLQIADPNQICYLTDITTVADFRRKDMAAGGEGAPLAPAFHQQVFHSDTEDRGILNIGGIANISLLPAGHDVKCNGFDTGPGNGLMDAWIKKNRGDDYDKNGQWASTGIVDATLLKTLMSDNFLHNTPPKSTGKEHYNLAWLEQQLTPFAHLQAADIQATLTEFTCNSISQAIKHYTPNIERLIICGGGAHNQHLLTRLKTNNPKLKIDTSDDHGIDPDWVEAIAFAWLARQTLNHRPGNLTDVTGAKSPTILGGVYYR